jgi:hypothetical protein
MRILVCGGRAYSWTVGAGGKKVRNYEEYDTFYGVMDKYLTEELTLISGHATGADQLAEEWAFERQIPIYIFPAEWNKYKKAAGPIRNQRMLDEGKPDLVIAFPGNSGTADMVKKAKKAGIKVIEIE